MIKVYELLQHAELGMGSITTWYRGTRESLLEVLSGKSYSQLCRQRQTVTAHHIQSVIEV